MYSSIFRALPGPTWLKVIQALILVLAIIAVLFTWVFPWLAQNISMFDNTVG